MARKARNKRLLVDYGLTIVAAVLIAVAIRMFVVEAYRIPSAAMRPTLLPGDTIFVSKWGYALAPGGRRHTTKRGDIVVFSPKSDASLNFIKRVIGLPGDILSVRNGEVNLNGKQVTHLSGDCGKETPAPQLTYEVCREKPALEDFGPERIPENSVF